MPPRPTNESTNESYVAGNECSNFNKSKHLDPKSKRTIAANPAKGPKAGAGMVMEGKLALGRPRGRRQNLNPKPKMNLNHANLKHQNPWAVASQEFARFAQEFHSNQSFTFQCRSCAQADFVAVAAGAGRAGVGMDHIGVVRDRCSLEWCAGLVGGLAQSHRKSAAQVDMCL